MLLCLMDEFEEFQTRIEQTAKTFSVSEDSEVEPPRDPDLEKHLAVFDSLAEKYKEPNKPFENYDLEAEDVEIFTSAYHGLNGELTKRSLKYRNAVINSPLYPPTTKGKIYRFVDNILNQNEFRENERIRMLGNRKIPNPYMTAREYIAALLLSQVETKTVLPELLLLVTMNIRKLDRIAQENLNAEKL